MRFQRYCPSFRHRGTPIEEIRLALRALPEESGPVTKSYTSAALQPRAKAGAMSRKRPAADSKHTALQYTSFPIVAAMCTLAKSTPESTAKPVIVFAPF